MKKADEKPTRKNEKHDKLDKILEKLEKIEKQSRRSLEDEFFLGLVLALALLFITFPSLTDFSSFFQNYFEATLEDASRTALFLKVLLILGFVASSVLRYYGAIKENEKCKYLSLESLVFVISFLITSLVINGLGSFVVNKWGTKAFVPMPALLIICIYIVGLFEKRLLKFYFNIGQLKSKASYFPTLHAVFLGIAIWMLAALLFALIFDLPFISIHLRPFHTPIIIVTILILSSAISILISLKYIRTLERKWSALT